MEPHPFTILDLNPGHEPHPNSPFPPLPDLPYVSAPARALDGDPLGWWQLIGGAWRWVTNPNPKP
jgi:hypothetical protein